MIITYNRKIYLINHDYVKFFSCHICVVDVKSLIIHCSLSIIIIEGGIRNESLIIGRKATRKNILVSFIAFIFYGLIGGIGTGGLLTFLTPLNHSICIFIGIIAFFVTMLIVVPLATITDYLEINPIFINYYVYKGYFQMLLETINLIIGKQTYPQKQINLNDIKNIELSYEPISMLWAQKGYKIKLLFQKNYICLFDYLFISS